MSDISSLPYWLTLHKLFLKSLFLYVVKINLNCQDSGSEIQVTRTNQLKGSLASAVGQESPL